MSFSEGGLGLRRDRRRFDHVPLWFSLGSLARRSGSNSPLSIELYREQHGDAMFAA